MNNDHSGETKANTDFRHNKEEECLCKKMSENFIIQKNFPISNTDGKRAEPKFTQCVVGSTCSFFFSSFFWTFYFLRKILTLKKEKGKLSWNSFGLVCTIFLLVLFYFFHIFSIHNHTLIEIREYFIILCIPQYLVVPWAQDRK
jgi:hypothetical protein